MAEHQVLFCPFCRESFEGRTACPEHELVLVTFERLAPEVTADELDGAPEDRGEERCAPLDLRHGRGLVALGALLVGLALGLDFLRFGAASSLRTFELAHGRPSLWTLGLVSFTVLYALARRRTLRELRGLRLVVPVLSVLPVLTVVLVLSRGVAAQAELGLALYAVALGSLLLLWGGLRLGAR